MLRVLHAILHAFDFEVGSAYLSQAELPLDDRQTKSYVQRHLRRITASPESRHGEFAEDSLFAGQLVDYLSGRDGFVELSISVAQWFWEELRRADAVEQADLLVAEFEETVDVKASSCEDEVAASFDGDAPRYFAVLVLPRKLTFSHELDIDANGIFRNDGTLPSPTQKIVSYLLVNERTMAIDFSDKPRLIAGREVNVIADDFLKCHARPSGRDVFAAVSSIVEEVAEQAGLNPALEVSRAKAVLAREAEEGEVVSPLQVGRRVFADREDLVERYEHETAQQQLPDEVPVRRGAANRMAKTHSLRTAPGVTSTFPSELADRKGYIDFTRGDDGRLTITIANVSRIDNR
ncbi:MAG: nucleoid-associated protein [Atopobiaceae bacterium]|nr:nucleoid-associated protein [Atopobiaceae bacterium]